MAKPAAAPDPAPTPTPDPAPAPATITITIRPTRNLYAVLEGDTEIYRASTWTKARAWAQHNRGTDPGPEPTEPTPS